MIIGDATAPPVATVIRPAAAVRVRVLAVRGRPCKAPAVALEPAVETTTTNRTVVPVGRVPGEARAVAAAVTKATVVPLPSEPKQKAARNARSVDDRGVVAVEATDRSNRRS